jgi:hypothetical protein
MNKWLVGAAVTSAMAISALVSLSSTVRKHSTPQPGEARDRASIATRVSEPAFQVAGAGKFNKPLRMQLDYPGVTDVEFISAAATQLDDAAIVFGIVVDGDAYAFSRQGMQLETRHIVNTIIHGNPISVTFCGFSGCARVLSANRGSGAIDLRVGGLDIDRQMVYLFKGIRYAQKSTALPLRDFPFERTTLGSWKKLHPYTLVYEGKSI